MGLDILEYYVSSTHKILLCKNLVERFTIKDRTLIFYGKSMIDGNIWLGGTPYQWEIICMKSNIISWVNLDSNIWSGGTQ